MASGPEHQADEVARRLAEAADPARAVQEKRYLKSDLEHLGVTVWAVRRIVQDYLRANPGPSRPELIALVEELWRRPVHELRSAAVDLLRLRVTLLEADDLALVERLIRESKTWALVDELAARVAGPLVERYPELAEALDRWAADADFWVRRSALLAHLLGLRRGEGEFERFGRFADGMLEEREFFIRKAIGWVLRDTARKRPDLVYGWIEPRAGRASGVTMREVVKPLSPEQREHLLAVRERSGAGRRRAPVRSAG